MISFNNGICKVKYNNIEYEGVCGLKKEEDLSFYFTFNDDKNYKVNIYKAKLSDGKMFCTLIKGTNIDGTVNANLELIYIDNSTDIGIAYQQVRGNKELEIKAKEAKAEAERKEEEKRQQEEREKQEFLESCKSYTYEEMARNPENFKFITCTIF